jgi:Spy/CpxP family protein refolding chaperone
MRTMVVALTLLLSTTAFAHMAAASGVTSTGEPPSSSQQNASETVR